MGAVDVPNATSLAALAFAAAVAGLVKFFEHRKSKKNEAQPSGDDTQVVAASFVERRLMERLIEAVVALNSNVVTLNGHVSSIDGRMHEDEIVRAAVAKMKESRP